MFIAAAAPLEAREAAILREFAATGRLTKNKIAAIVHLFPRGLVLYSRLPGEKAYQKPYSKYAEIYGAGLSTIKWWIAQGKKHPRGERLPPLDRPREMPDWWHRTMSQRVPENIVTAARNDDLQEVSFSKTPARPVALPLLAEPKNELAPSADIPHAEGFLLHLRNLRAQTKKAHDDLEAAQLAKVRDDGNDANIIALTRRYLQLEAALQSAEQKAPEILRKLSLMVEREEVANLLGPMLKAVGDGILALRRRLKNQLADAPDENTADGIWHRGVYEVFAELSRSGYVAPFTLAAA